jgi:hypothetical protein
MIYISMTSTIFPRTVILLLYFYSSWFSGVFATWYWPFLGFVIMPHTMLWYSAVKIWFDGDWGFWQVVALIVFIIWDISAEKSQIN